MVLILAKECQKECVDGRHLGTSRQNDKFCITELNKRCYKDIEKGNEIRVIAERKLSNGKVKEVSLKACEQTDKGEMQL